MLIVQSGLPRECRHHDEGREQRNDGAADHQRVTEDRRLAPDLQQRRQQRPVVPACGAMPSQTSLMPSTSTME
jgi:hypothetical protein